MIFWREKKKYWQKHKKQKVEKKSLFYERNRKTMTFYIKEDISRTGCFCFSLADRLLLCYTVNECQILECLAEYDRWSV